MYVQVDAAVILEDEAGAQIQADFFSHDNVPENTEFDP